MLADRILHFAPPRCILHSLSALGKATPSRSAQATPLIRNKGLSGSNSALWDFRSPINPTQPKCCGESRSSYITCWVRFPVGCTRLRLLAVRPACSRHWWNVAPQPQLLPIMFRYRFAFTVVISMTECTHHWMMASLMRPARAVATLVSLTAIVCSVWAVS